jgi:hypothetical protein
LKSQTRQQPSNAFRIVLIHLAPVGYEVKPGRCFCHVHAQNPNIYARF